MPEFGIYDIAVGQSGARLGICPIPGRGGDFAADMATVLAWEPSLVFSMTTQQELVHAGATDLPVRLHDAGCSWIHLPVVDFGEPTGETAAYWPHAATQAYAVLDAGSRVLIHCYGGQGRSGMAALRLLVERGEATDVALARLRQARPGAVETEAQKVWASKPDRRHPQ